MNHTTRTMFSIMKKLSVAGVLTTALCGTAFAEGLTKEQGDAMINELRQIRQLLTRAVTPQQAPAPPAAPEHVKLKLGKEFALGRKDAPLVMVEYTDYQCPFCNRFYTGTFPELKKQYIDTGKLRFITRDFPLEFHPQAMKAAQGAHCAGEQEKFWPMKDSLMLNSASLTPELINKLAEQNGVNMEKFRTCMDSGRYLPEIQASEAAGKAIGINGTPSFVVGRVNGDVLEGELVVGAFPFANFDAILKRLLGEGR
jgi:protein-disulfide isomerase